MNDATDHLANNSPLLAPPSGRYIVAKATPVDPIALGFEHAETLLRLTPHDRERAEAITAQRVAVDMPLQEVDEQTASSWSPVDLGPILAGDPTALEPAPVFLEREDGEHLIYAGKVHLVSGRPEASKGWLAMAASAERLRAGEHVLYVDFEDGPAVAVERMLALGAASADIAERFHYVRPSEAFDERGRQALEGLIVEHAPTLAVLDGLTDALGLEGLSTDSNDEVSKWMRDLPEALKRRGVAVLLITHQAKAATHSDPNALGAMASLRRSDVHYRLVAEKAFGRGLTGRVKVSERKDRPGHVKPLAGNGGHVADMVGVSEDGRMSITLEVPSVAGFQPTELRRQISEAIVDNPGMTVRAVRALPGRNAYKTDAIEYLIGEGFVEVRAEGAARRHYSVRPYTEQAAEVAADQGLPVA